MGFGDVKLAGVLGLYLGWLGWAEVVDGGFLGFLFGGVVGVALMVVRRAGRKSQIPFGPFMLAGRVRRDPVGRRFGRPLPRQRRWAEPIAQGERRSADPPS